MKSDKQKEGINAAAALNDKTNSLYSRMLLYAVTDRSWLNGRSLRQDVLSALQGGATMIQLREKELDFQSFLSEAKEIKAVCAQYKVPLIINDNIEIALACGADGVHLGQSDETARNARLKLGKDKIIGISVQTAEQAAAAQQEGADYLGVGAVFATSTKKDADFVSYEVLKSICSSVSIPVCAIGGINKQNIMQLAGSGIDGVALVSAIFVAQDIESECIELLKLSKKDGTGMSIKGAIFDLDGTILDSMSVWRTMGSNYLLSRNIQPEEGLDQKFNSMSIAQAAQYYIDNYHLPESVEELIKDIDSKIEQFYFERVKPKPGIKRFLEELKENGICMCIATATDRYLAEPALARNGLDKFFLDIFTCNMVGAGKDQPLIYETALARLGTPKNQTVVFEDAPHALRTANKAGFKTACVYDPVFKASWPDMLVLSDYHIVSFNQAGGI